MEKDKVVSNVRKSILARIDDMITELRNIQKGNVECPDCEGYGAQADPEIAELLRQQVAARDDKKRDEIIEKIQDLMNDGRHEEFTCPECEGTGRKQDFGAGYKIQALEQAKQAINELVERIEENKENSEK